MKAPDFWSSSDGGAAAFLLRPASWLYEIGTGIRNALAGPAWQAPIPVICVGNVTAGGAGKTPVALDLGQRLRDQGRAVHFLSRGYGGTEHGPLRVEPERHLSNEVGDEPLLLAQIAPTWVARDRAAGIKCAVDAGAEAVVMDDGFQNPSVAKDLSILVVDGGFGFGNGHILPAGPLRERPQSALTRAQAAVIIGADETGVEPALSAALAFFRARTVSARPVADVPAHQPWLAFAGISRPEKFFATLRESGHQIAETRNFPDHHPYSAADLVDLRNRAAGLQARLITTEKDWVRLGPEARNDIETLTITLQWDDEAALNLMLTALFD